MPSLGVGPSEAEPQLSPSPESQVGSGDGDGDGDGDSCVSAYQSRSCHSGSRSPSGLAIAVDYVSASLDITALASDS